MTALCTALYQDINHPSWHEYELEKLPARELEFLCRMFGCAKSGNKYKVALRLMMIRRARFDLAKFTDDPHELAAAFKRSRLRQICEIGNLWKSGNKTQLAAVILQWRNQCRLDGQRFLQECIAYGKSVPKQMELIPA